MVTAKLAALGAVLLLGSLLTPRTGLTQDCLPADDVVGATHNYAVELATTSDPEMIIDRDSYGILPVPESEVEVVTHTNTCRKAGREYKKELGLSGKAPSVHVVRIGTRYLVFDPDTATADSEFISYVIFDDQFSKVGSFVG